MSEHRWSDLEPEPGLLAALEAAGEKNPFGTQNEKRRWSELFADACAVMISDRLRAHPSLGKKRSLPNADGSGRAPITPLDSGTRKRIDVVVVDKILVLRSESP